MEKTLLTLALALLCTAVAAQSLCKFVCWRDNRTFVYGHFVSFHALGRGLASKTTEEVKFMFILG